MSWTGTDRFDVTAARIVVAFIRHRYEGFAPSEIALLQMADAQADTPSNISDDLCQELTKHLSTEKLMELAAAAAAENYRARFNRV